MRKVMSDVREFMLVGGQHVADRLEPIQIDDSTKELLSLSRGAFEHLFDLWAPAMHSPPSDPGSALAFLRARLIAEETAETLSALADSDRAKFADGLADLVYVIAGAALSYGIPLERVWEEVNRANMSKFWDCVRCDGEGCRKCGGRGKVSIKDAGGKIQKPPSWSPPDIESVLEEEP